MQRRLVALNVAMLQSVNVVESSVKVVPKANQLAFCVARDIRTGNAVGVVRLESS